MEGIFRIKEVLKEKGMSGERLAELIGMSPVSLSYIINGKKNTGINTLVKIAAVLEVEVRDLFTSAAEEPIYVKKGDGFERIGSIKGGF